MKMKRDDDSEGGAKKPKTTGFVLEYDAARKIAQGLGAHLEDLSSLVEVSGDQARLLPVGERARHLFGKEEGKVTPARKKKVPQLDLFKVLEQADDGGTTFGETKVERHGETVLDRIHQSMILFAAGRSEAMKRFLVEDGAGRDPRFWRLAQALSALYPSSTEGATRKRWVDGVLARKKGLGILIPHECLAHDCLLFSCNSSLARFIRTAFYGVVVTIDLFPFLESWLSEKKTN